MRSRRAPTRLLSGLVTTAVAVAMGLPRPLLVQHEHEGGGRPHVHSSASSPHSHARTPPLPFAENDDDLDLIERRSGQDPRLGWSVVPSASTHHAHWQQLFQPATVTATSLVVGEQPVATVSSGRGLVGTACVPQRLRARAPPHCLRG